MSIVETHVLLRGSVRDAGTAVAAAVFELAIDGFLTIRDGGPRGVILVRTDKAGKLTAGRREVLAMLFGASDTYGRGIELRHFDNKEPLTDLGLDGFGDCDPTPQLNIYTRTDKSAASANLKQRRALRELFGAADTHGVRLETLTSLPSGVRHPMDAARARLIKSGLAKPLAPSRVAKRVMHTYWIATPVAVAAIQVAVGFDLAVLGGSLLGAYVAWAVAEFGLRRPVLARRVFLTRRGKAKAERFKSVQPAPPPGDVLAALPRAILERYSRMYDRELNEFLRALPATKPPWWEGPWMGPSVHSVVRILAFELGRRPPKPENEPADTLGTGYGEFDMDADADDD